MQAITVPTPLVLLVLSELTFCCPEKLYAFLSNHHLGGGKFPHCMQMVTEADDLMLGILDHLQEYPELVRGTIPDGTYYALALPSDMVRKGIVVFDGTDPREDGDSGISMVYLTDDMMLGMDGDPETDPRAYAFSLLMTIIREMLENWLTFTFPPFTSKAMH